MSGILSLSLLKYNNIFDKNTKKENKNTKNRKDVYKNTKIRDKNIKTINYAENNKQLCFRGMLMVYM
jgi:hypothetical protein